MSLCVRGRVPGVHSIEDPAPYDLNLHECSVIQDVTRAAFRCAVRVHGTVMEYTEAFQGVEA